MKVIYYAKRKKGIHGFLKLAEQDAISADGGVDCFGEEIHFRVGKTLVDRFKGLGGVGIDPEGKALGLKVYHRTRQKSKFDFVEIQCGGDAEMDNLWARLKDHAIKENQHDNVYKKYEVNCHTLAFKVLEREGLSAPWALYRTYLLNQTNLNQINAVDIHPPSSAPQ